MSQKRTLKSYDQEQLHLERWWLTPLGQIYSHEEMQQIAQHLRQCFGQYRARAL